MTEEDYQGNERVLERCIVMIDFYDSVHLMGKKNANGGGIATR